MAKDLLKDISIRNAKPSDKNQRLTDGGGLYILIKSNGSKWWCFDYTINGTRKTLSFGVYPSTSLSAHVPNAMTHSNTSLKELTPL